VLSIAAFIIGALKTFKTATYVGVGILFLTLFKLVLYDLPFIPMAIRALLFIVLGAIGLIISRLFYKKK
jgi:multidrug transporter EmrE-like cation transporter